MSHAVAFFRGRKAGEDTASAAGIFHAGAFFLQLLNTIKRRINIFADILLTHLIDKDGISANNLSRLRLHTAQ